jgi:hypothetical protein
MANAQREDLEAALSARIETIFDRCSELCGFSVDERPVSKNGKEGVREWELYVSAVAAYPELGTSQTDGFIGEISEVLADLLNQRPQAADLLPGRTFARVWH